MTEEGAGGAFWPSGRHDDEIGGGTPAERDPALRRREYPPGVFSIFFRLEPHSTLQM